MLTTATPDTLPLESYRQLAARLWAWGRVCAHRELGMLNYPKITDDERRRALKRLGSVPDMALSYLDIERCLIDQPPIVRGLLYTLYGRRHAQLHTVPLEVEPSYRLHIDDFIELAYGDLLTEGERRSQSRTLGRIKSIWCRHAIEQLGLVEPLQVAGGVAKAA